MNKPDFTGVWKFNRERSSLQIPPPDSTVFVIEHREPRFHLERTHVFGPRSDFFEFDSSTEGGIVELTHADVTIHGRLYWEGDVLVFDSELRRDDMHGTNIVRYRLTDTGRTLVALERLEIGDDCHDNIWLFDKQ